MEGTERLLLQLTQSCPLIEIEFKEYIKKRLKSDAGFEHKLKVTPASTNFNFFPGRVRTFQSPNSNL